MTESWPDGWQAGAEGRVRWLSTARSDFLPGGECDLAQSEPRHRLARRLGVGIGWLRQQHGRQVAFADPTADPPPSADACISNRAEVACAVLAADCLPLLLWAADASAVAAVHAGWRGLLAGVVPAAVAELCALAGADTVLRAHIGPHIRQPAYEVGPELRDAFVAAAPANASAFVSGRGDRWHADLAALCRRQLADCGIEEVSDGLACTHSGPEYFSHRRGDRGRQAALIWIEP